MITLIFWYPVMLSEIWEGNIGDGGRTLSAWIVAAATALFITIAHISFQSISSPLLFPYLICIYLWIGWWTNLSIRHFLSLRLLF